MAFSGDETADVGTDTACHGSARYSVALAGPHESIGDPDTLRLQGTYRASYTRGEGAILVLHADEGEGLGLPEAAPAEGGSG